MPLTSVQFVTALQARQVDVGVVRQASVYGHLHQYAQDGPRSVETNVVDLLTLGWAPGRVLTDWAKFAAIAVHLPIQARSSVWEYENPKICLCEYYINQEGLTREQGASIIKATPKPILPISWDEAIALEQETADLMPLLGLWRSSTRRRCSTGDSIASPPS